MGIYLIVKIYSYTILRMIFENPMGFGLFGVFLLLIVANFIFNRPVKALWPQSKSLKVLMRMNDKSRK